MQTMELTDTDVRRPGRVVSWLLEQNTREAEVVGVEAISEGFRLVRFAGTQLRGVNWTPGDMIQLILAGSTLLGPWELRAYTPLAFDTDQGTMDILVAIHGEALASDWFAAAEAGTKCRFVGPKTALPKQQGIEPIVFFGDETSLGTAIALFTTKPIDPRNRFVFEVGSEHEAQTALGRYGLTECSVVARTADNRHLDAVEAVLVEAASDSSRFILTGQAPSIQRLYKALRSAGIAGNQVNNIPYWSPGKKGLKG